MTSRPRPTTSSRPQFQVSPVTLLNTLVERICQEDDDFIQRATAVASGAMVPNTRPPRPSLADLERDAILHQEMFDIADSGLKAALGRPEKLEAYKRKSHFQDMPPIEVEKRSPTVDELEAITQLAMLGCMYKFTRYKMRLFIDDVRLALGQEPLDGSSKQAGEDDVSLKKSKASGRKKKPLGIL